MIVDIPKTTVSAVSKKLIDLRDEGGVGALSRALTLIILSSENDVEDAIASANEASLEHPMRIIVLVDSAMKAEGTPEPNRLDAEIRVGSHAGASEVIILRAFGDTGSNQESLVTGLLLPDAPVVAWWAGATPDDANTTEIGRLSQRRITDLKYSLDPVALLYRRRETYSPGDTDMAWTRLTEWRTQIAATLDTPPFESVTAATVKGTTASASVDLLSAWLALRLQVPVTIKRQPIDPGMGGVHEVIMTRASGDISLTRVSGSNAVILSKPGDPEHEILVRRRSVPECLIEELRRLDPDEAFGEVLLSGLAEVPQNKPSVTLTSPE